MFSEAGENVLRLTADDGELSDSDEVLITVISSGNTAPEVNAGDDQTQTFGAIVQLNGSVIDDGNPNPPGLTTTSWTKLSGLGEVTFADMADPATTATFSDPGAYTLRLSADDGEIKTEDDVIITVSEPTGISVIDTQVTESTDDAEENDAGKVSLNNNDLDLVYDKRDQIVGIRFAGVPIPSGASIISASIQFTVSSPSSGAAFLTIEGERAGTSLTFDRNDGNVSSRPRTINKVEWTPSVWLTSGEAGSDQQTPDLAAVIQEVVDQPGWTAGNALTFVVSGSGSRVAESVDSDASAAPSLHIEYLSP